jgi:hypothetical protein
MIIPECVDRNRLDLINHLGGPKCVFCGCEDYKLLHIDHIDPEDAREDRARFCNPNARNRYYLKHLEEVRHKLRILCGLCNRRRLRKK